MAEDPEQVLPEQRIAAAGGTKKLVPKNRSNMSRISATVMTGNASSSSTA